MAKLPARQKVSVLCFRREAVIDEVLVVQRDAKRAPPIGLPSDEAAAGESARDAALRIAARVTGGAALGELDLGITASYRVSEGPRAGEWTERFHAVEVADTGRAREGIWMPHYEAKANAGADAPRVREAFSRLRDVAKLKP